MDEISIRDAQDGDSEFDAQDGDTEFIAQTLRHMVADMARHGGHAPAADDAA